MSCSCLYRSGFFLFCSEHRPSIKAQNPSMGIGDVAKKLGEMWNNLSDSEKQPFLSKANKLKDKYQKVRLNILFIREPKQLDYNSGTNCLNSIEILIQNTYCIVIFGWKRGWFDILNCIFIGKCDVCIPPVS